MTENNERINQLLETVESLVKRQYDLLKELNNLKADINQLNHQEIANITGNSEIVANQENKAAIIEEIKEEEVVNYQVNIQPPIIEPPQSPVTNINQTPKQKSDLEKFIGENLINKVGIGITIIGVAIGTKYSIENDLINPITRIILGYLFGLTMLGLGIKLKNKYENYSAVLVSGAMAIMYFITYFAFDLYNLIPQSITFILMWIFTIFTVVTAIKYNKQIIAHIGLVGAYTVPFLLSEGSGKVEVLFSYMAIINIGILAIAFKKFWKPLNYVSFFLTWIIFLSWFFNKYQSNENFTLALVFVSFFYVIFYLTFIANRLLKKEKFEIDDTLLILVNSFVFYGAGYAILSSYNTGVDFLGLFTVINAGVHFVVRTILFKRTLTDINVYYVLTGLSILFITLAIPVQLEGKVVTLLWATEAALLFWLGRTKKVSFYESSSYLFMLLAFLSILQDWLNGYSYNPQIPSTRLSFILNENFLTSIVFISAFFVINYLNRNKKYESHLTTQTEIAKVFYFVIPAILMVSIYLAFSLEIANYWNQLCIDADIKINSENIDYQNYSAIRYLQLLKSIWLINYTILFVSFLSFLDFKKLNIELFKFINLWLIIIGLVVFLTKGLSNLSELRQGFLEQTIPKSNAWGSFILYVRYFSFPIVALSIYSCYNYLNNEDAQRKNRVEFDFLLHTTILWVASSELLNLMDLFKSEQSDKFGLTILWGLYSLFLIVFGIWKRKKFLRIGAISLFGFTLLKLFFYDISDLDTIAKTIVFVSLGVLLLIISFLYNKYKHVITDNGAKTDDAATGNQ